MTFQRVEKTGCDLQHKDAAALESWDLERDGQIWKGRKGGNKDTLEIPSSML